MKTSGIGRLSRRDAVGTRFLLRHSNQKVGRVSPNPPSRQPRKSGALGITRPTSGELTRLRPLAPRSGAISRRWTAGAVLSGHDNSRRSRLGAFSLVEVVAAIGILAVALIAVLGLIVATVRSGGEIADADALARLGENIQGELERFQASLGLADMTDLIAPGGSGRPLCLVATRNGQGVRCADGAYPAADRALNDPMLPGIANRDRYFLIEVSQSPGLEAALASGFLAVSARITWPYQLPIGLPTPGATARDADPAREVPANERNLAIFNCVLRP